MSKMMRRISPFTDKCKFNINHTKINVQRYAVVHISLIRGINLPKLNKNGKPSDPYCEIALGKKTSKSKAIPKTVSPEWKEEFDFNWYKGIDDVLRITAYNKNYGDLPLDDRMGHIQIDLNDLQIEKTYHQWKNVENDGEINGQIFILVTISGTTSEDAPTNLSRFENEIESIQAKWSQTYSSFSRASRIDTSVGYLMIKVLEAKGLANTDIIGKSDPFCVIELNNERRITQTACNNLTPTWNKVFQFEEIKDVCDTVYITLYDENYDDKPDLLGRLRIPLLNIENNDKRWYSLKDKNLRHSAPGNKPKVLLEMFFIYNKVLAGICTLQSPRERVYKKEKRPKLYKSSSYSIRRIKATRTGDALGKIIATFKKLKHPDEEGTISLPTTHILLFFIAFFFEPWMVPVFLILPFLLSFLYPRQTATYHEPLPELSTDNIDINDEIESALGISWLKEVTTKMRKFQELNFTAQIGLEWLANMLESVENLFNFSVPFVSIVAIVLLLTYTILLSWFSVRQIMLAWIVKDGITTFVGSKRFKNGNFIHFMSRVPDNEELEDYREL